MAEESFSLVLTTPGGATHELTEISGSDSIKTLYTKAAARAGVREGALKLIHDGKLLSGDLSQILSEVGVGPGTTLTAASNACPRIFWRGYECREDYNYNWHEVESQ